MTVKFSPGPWSINKTRKYDGGYGRKSGAIIDANGEPIVLFDPSDGEYTPALDEGSPDAKLIAAAPDLLDALEGILGYFDSGNSVSVSQATIKASSDEVKAARAAIAKAMYKEP